MLRRVLTRQRVLHNKTSYRFFMHVVAWCFRFKPVALKLLGRKQCISSVCLSWVRACDLVARVPATLNPKP